MTDGHRSLQVYIKKYRSLWIFISTAEVSVKYKLQYVSNTHRPVSKALESVRETSDTDEKNLAQNKPVFSPEVMFL